MYSTHTLTMWWSICTITLNGSNAGTVNNYYNYINVFFSWHAQLNFNCIFVLFCCPFNFNKNMLLVIVLLNSHSTKDAYFSVTFDIIVPQHRCISNQIKSLEIRTIVACYTCSYQRTVLSCSPQPRGKTFDMFVSRMEGVGDNVQSVLQCAGVYQSCGVL